VPWPALPLLVSHLAAVHVLVHSSPIISPLPRPFNASQGLADPQRLCIDGGSAGGYTTLACLAFR
jgi:hypothetical protein